MLKSLPHLSCISTKLPSKFLCKEHFKNILLVLGLNKSVDLQIKGDLAKEIHYIRFSLVITVDVLGHL
jgi:hypothetical protein